MQTSETICLGDFIVIPGSSVPRGGGASMVLLNSLLWTLGRVVGYDAEWVTVVPYEIVGSDSSLTAELQRLGGTKVRQGGSSVSARSGRLSGVGSKSPTLHPQQQRSGGAGFRNNAGNAPFRRPSFSNLATDDQSARRRSVVVHPAPPSSNDDRSSFQWGVSVGRQQQQPLSTTDRNKLLFLQEMMFVVERSFGLVKEARIAHNRHYGLVGDADVDPDEPAVVSIVCGVPEGATSVCIPPTTRGKSHSGQHQPDDISKRGSVASSSGSSKRTSTTRPFMGRRGTSSVRRGGDVNSHRPAAVTDTPRTNAAPVSPQSTSITTVDQNNLVPKLPMARALQQYEAPSYVVLIPMGNSGLMESDSTNTTAEQWESEERVPEHGTDSLTRALHAQGEKAVLSHIRVPRSSVLLARVSVLERTVVFNSVDPSSGGCGEAGNVLLGSDQPATEGHAGSHQSVSEGSTLIAKPAQGISVLPSPPSAPSNPQQHAGGRMKRRLSRLFGNNAQGVASLLEGGSKSPQRALPPSSGRQYPRSITSLVGNAPPQPSQQAQQLPVTSTPTATATQQPPAVLRQLRRSAQLIAVVDNALVRSFSASAQCFQQLQQATTYGQGQRQALSVSGGTPSLAPPQPPFTIVCHRSGDGVTLVLPFLSSLGVAQIVAHKDTLVDLTILFTSFNTTDFALSQLADMVAVHLTSSLQSLSIVRKDSSTLLPWTVGMLHQRAPLWLDQQSLELRTESDRRRSSSPQGHDDEGGSDDFPLGIQAVQVTESTGGGPPSNSNLSSPDSSPLGSRSVLIKAPSSPRRAIPTRDRCDSLVSAHLQIATEDSAPYNNKAGPVPSSNVGRVESTQSTHRMYSTLGQFRFGGGEAGDGGDMDYNASQHGSPWRFRHRRRSAETLIESGVSVDGGIQELVDAICFRYVCYSTTISPPLQPITNPFKFLSQLSLVNVGIQDNNVSALCTALPHIGLVNLSHNYLRGGFITSLTTSISNQLLSSSAIGSASSLPSRFALQHLNLSHNELSDQDLIPLIVPMRHSRDEQLLLSSGEGGKAEEGPVGESSRFTLLSLNLRFNRLSHTYRTDTLGPLSQSPLTGVVSLLLGRLFTRRGTEEFGVKEEQRGGTEGDAVERSINGGSATKAAVDRVLEFTQYRRGVAILY